MKLHSQTKDEPSFHQWKLAQKIIAADAGFVYFTLDLLPKGEKRIKIIKFAVSLTK